MANVPIDIHNDTIVPVGLNNSTVAIPANSSIRNMEKELIRQALNELKGNKSKVAKKLGISRRTLYRKLAEYEIV